MTHKEVLKNRIEHYLNRIMEIQKTIELTKKNGRYWNNYHISIEYYQKKIKETLEELVKE